MSKRRGLGPVGGSNPQMGGMMRQLQKMQEDMEKARIELESMTVEESGGGGAVTVVMTGHQRVESITVNPAMLDTSDEEWISDLQDLLTLAVNNAIEKSQTMAAQKMESITGGLGGIPGLGNLFG